MASYALLNAFSGFEFDMTKGLIGFAPLIPQPALPSEEFRCFWSLDSGWGEYVETANSAEIRVLSGSLDLQKVRLAALVGKSPTAVKLGSKGLKGTFQNGEVQFSAQTTIKSGGTLTIGW